MQNAIPPSSSPEPTTGPTTESIAGAGDPSKIVVQLDGLVRRFGEHTAVDGLDLVVRSRECLGLLGPNGAGKSTTVRILSTLLAPDAGRVEVLGHDLSRGESGAARAVRRRIGVVPQHLALYDRLSARENLSFFAGLQGKSGAGLREAVERGLALAGLEERADDAVSGFSGGMKRRLNVAVALLHDPELVFLDEPTVGIDPQSRNHVFECVEGLREQGLTMIYTSHQMEEVERLCSRIVILDRGRSIAEGTLDQLQERAIRARATDSEETASLCFPDADHARRALALLEDAGMDARIEEQRPSLEKVFLQLTGRELRDGGAA